MRDSRNYIARGKKCPVDVDHHELLSAISVLDHLDESPCWH